MKTTYIAAMLMLLSFFGPMTLQAQGLIETMTAQLAKLELFLQETRKGYEIFEKGLGTINDIKKGQLDLHSLFFGALNLVSPAIVNSPTVSATLSTLDHVQSGCTDGIRRYVNSSLFSSPDRQYIGSVYKRLQKANDEDLNELTHLLTTGELKMTDDERLHRLQTLSTAATEHYAFLRSFTNRLATLAFQTTQDKRSIQHLQQIMTP